MKGIKAEEILKKALEMEKGAIEEYTKMKKDADHETADLLDFLIAQEREHIKMINERLKAIRLLKD
ncbi:ferritin-like domain-containing protein [Archaeoglobus veneficus]|uniref:Ferritin/DPS domain-containing protein n=1 Tax=Archaeoglobus veneficus (strain DSM 11195 / SNP6) TaxID=693661 RepID=F2KQU3_ARCVS|nr:ferritin-like domain-containing protein [Archaeoglobus veneficus]AEA46655.1 hypothetical protein Arcve_0634 [Archaeoglobus veneficus SNP6]